MKIRFWKPDVTCGHPWLGRYALGLCQPCYFQAYWKRPGKLALKAAKMREYRIKWKARKLAVTSIEAA